jgi:MOSC domain-containing protein YiiM
MGRVASIYIAADEGKPVESRDEVEAVAGLGLRGDRYYLRRGAWSGDPKPGREVTLIESEAVEAAREEFGLVLEPREARRNIVTEGVRLNELVGREFVVGEVRLIGVRLCEPCEYLAGLTGQPVVKALIHRAGLRADIVDGGWIRVGDQIRIDEPAPSTADTAPQTS